MVEGGSGAGSARLSVESPRRAPSHTADILKRGVVQSANTSSPSTDAHAARLWDCCGGAGPGGHHVVLLVCSPATTGAMPASVVALLARAGLFGHRCGGGVVRFDDGVAVLPLDDGLNLDNLVGRHDRE